MKAAVLSLAQLREHIGALAKPTRPVWHFGSHMTVDDVVVDLHPVLHRGLPQGSICEFSGPVGSGKTSFVISLLAQHPTAVSAWIEPHWDMGPLPLVKARIPLQNVVGIEASDEWPWTTLQVVKSQLFSFVILSLFNSTAIERKSRMTTRSGTSRSVARAPENMATKVDEKWLRRMQLACEEACSTLFLIHEEPMTHSWPLYTQIHMTSPHTIDVLKTRGYV